MARQLRIQYEGAIYHLMSRGDRREAIFQHDLDRKSFLQALGAVCETTGWQVHAYCLMSNHFHLVIETPRSNLSAGMQWLLGSYTQRFNRRHRS
jgi:putative transposase